MKNYTKEQIKQIVQDCSRSIMEKNSQLFIENAIKSVQGKENNEALVVMLTLLYAETQKNCEDTIISVLNTILNKE